MTFEDYDTESFYDEMFLPDGSPRPEARQLVERIEGSSRATPGIR